MQQVLYIWWWNAYSTREAFIEELMKRDYDPFEIKKKRRFTLQKELWDDYQVAILDMPNKTFALYREWKIQFEKIFPYLNWDQIIIAHSLWTIFILKYLTENNFPKKIKQLHLVSALIDDKDLPPEESYIWDFAFNTTKIPEIQNICETTKDFGKICLSLQANSKLRWYESVDSYLLHATRQRNGLCRWRAWQHPADVGRCPYSGKGVPASG